MTMTVLLAIKPHDEDGGGSVALLAATNVPVTAKRRCTPLHATKARNIEGQSRTTCLNISNRHLTHEHPTLHVEHHPANRRVTL